MSRYMRALAGPCDLEGKSGQGNGTETSRCEDILITGVRIRANMKLPNADGIDLDRCRRARISDCDIRCADDGISLKSCREFHEYGPTEDVGEYGSDQIVRARAEHISRHQLHDRYQVERLGRWSRQRRSNEERDFLQLCHPRKQSRSLREQFVILLSEGY